MTINSIILSCAIFFSPHFVNKVIQAETVPWKKAIYCVHWTVWVHLLSSPSVPASNAPVLLWGCSVGLRAQVVLQSWRRRVVCVYLRKTYLSGSVVSIQAILKSVITALFFLWALNKGWAGKLRQNMFLLFYGSSKQTKLNLPWHSITSNLWLTVSSQGSMPASWQQ